MNWCSWFWFNILPKCFHFLRILGGVTDSFVFILHGEEFIVRENVFVQHLTDVSFFIKCCKTKRISIIIHYSFTFTLLFSISSLFAKIYFTLYNSYLIFFMVSCCRILWKVISPVLRSTAPMYIVCYALRRSLSVGHVTCQSQTPTAWLAKPTRHSLMQSPTSLNLWGKSWR